jgi:hypothetical protein
MGQLTLNHVQALLYGRLDQLHPARPVKYLKSALSEGTVSLQSVLTCAAELKTSASGLFLPGISIPIVDRYMAVVSTITMYHTKLRSACNGAMPTLPPPLLAIVVNYITGRPNGIHRTPISRRVFLRIVRLGLCR